MVLRTLPFSASTTCHDGPSNCGPLAALPFESCLFARFQHNFGDVSGSVSSDDVLAGRHQDADLRRDSGVAKVAVNIFSGMRPMILVDADSFGELGSGGNS